MNANLPDTDGYARPRFLILGAQKAGTVALFRYLASHPKIVPAHRKEIAFFDQDTLFARGYDWYHNQFPAKQILGDRVTFEATPAYLYYQAVPSRLFAYDPDIKLIVLLRNPIARAISAWNMYRDLRLNQPDYLLSLLPECDEGTRAMFKTMLAGDSFPDADEAMQNEIGEILSGVAVRDPGYVQRGLYYEQLQRYLKYFDRGQIAIVESVRLKTELTTVLNELVRFLDLPAHDWHSTDLSLHHVGQYDTPVSPGTHELLRDFYRPHNERLYELLGRDLGWEREAT